MNIRRILTIATASAVAGAGALAPIGSAADDAEALKVTGAYAYIDTISTASSPLRSARTELLTAPPRTTRRALL